MKMILAILALGMSMAVQAQVCDVLYVVDVNTETNDVTTAKAWVYGLPTADMEDNTAKGKRVIDIASKVQDQGGPYQIELGEWRTCDGKTVKVDANSIMVKGVTLKGANRINRMALKVMDEVQSRYDLRGNKGHKHGWDHAKARKTQRDDLGKKKD